MILTVLRALVEEDDVRRHGPPLRVSVEQIGLRPSGEVDPSTPLVQRAMAVTIGRAGAGRANHSPDEWWVNENGHLGIQRALLLLLAEAGYRGEKLR